MKVHIPSPSLTLTNNGQRTVAALSLVITRFSSRASSKASRCLWRLVLRLVSEYAIQLVRSEAYPNSTYPTDVGNLQRLTNGPLWNEHLAVGWNASLYSFAFDGAVCDNALFSDNSTYTPSIRDQIEAYYNQQLDLDPEETIYAFWIGINDIERSFHLQDPSASLKSTVACLSQQLVKIE